MKYYRDIDYFLYFEDFPHMGIPGAIVSNSDGTVTIYINTLYSRRKQEETIRHELRHMVKEHLQNDILTIEEKELEASRIHDTDCFFGENFSFVEYLPEEAPSKSAHAFLAKAVCWHPNREQAVKA